MQIIDELLTGCYLLRPSIYRDNRGIFVKTYQKSIFLDQGFDFEIREEFFSISNKNVIRGMHFQIPPYDHSKLIYCAQGSLLDVLLDLRKGNDYGRVATSFLSGENRHLIYIPKGVAHGFLAMEENTLMVYKTSTVHMPEFDQGVHWNSFGFNWGVEKPFLSLRDKNHIEFKKFNSPFNIRNEQ